MHEGFQLKAHADDKPCCFRTQQPWQARQLASTAIWAGWDDRDVCRTEDKASDAQQLVAIQGDDIYPMLHSPRGKCIIIDNVDNSDIRRVSKPHKRYDADLCLMEELFSSLYFNCVSYQDLAAKEMKEVLKAVTKPDQQEGAECLVVVLKSHGDKETIYGADDKPLHLYSEVYPLFVDENCPDLGGKPKLFFIETWCGMRYSDTANVERASAKVVPYPVPPASMSSSANQNTPCFLDMFITYATVPSYMALKDKESGWTFFSVINSVFRKFASCMHLEDLMHLVHREMLGRAAHDQASVAPSTELYGWTKKLYFHPGLCSLQRPELK